MTSYSIQQNIHNIHPRVFLRGIVLQKQFIVTIFATFFLLLIIVWLLFESVIYFFGKSTDINDSWIHMGNTVTTTVGCHQ